MRFQWSSKRIDNLKILFEAGLSAAQIAGELGGDLTRNAVIGKIHRLGLSGRAKSPAPASREAKPRRERKVSQYLRQNAKPNYRGQHVAAVAMLPDAAPAPTPEVIPIHQRVALMELTDAVCHWPVGDPLQPEFHFCGGRAINGMPYCAHHCRIAYEPAREPQRSRRGFRPGRHLYGWA